MDLAARRATGLISLLAALLALYLWPDNPAGNVGLSLEPGQRHLEVVPPEGPDARLEVQAAVDAFLGGQPPISVCGRTSCNYNSTSANLPPPEPAACPAYDHHKPIVVLEGYMTFGRTGNQLASLQNAMQYAHDRGCELGIMQKSWAADVLLQFFFVRDSVEGGANDESTGGAEDRREVWAKRIEEALCIKVIKAPEEVEGRRVILRSSVQLFYYQSISPHDELIARQLQTLRTLFRHYNTGKGTDNYGRQALDMCSGINYLFGEERSVKYSVIHLRYMEGNLQHMRGAADRTGCDPHGAAHMTPEYVKSILEPLGILHRPIVVITDGQNPRAIKRLQEDPEIGEWIRLVPQEVGWMGGDIALAVAATAFIGNPASTFSGFIAASRIALGYGHNYLFRARDTSSKWTDSCGVECIFDLPKKYLQAKSHSVLDYQAHYWMMTDKRPRRKQREWKVHQEISHATQALKRYASNKYAFGHKQFTGLHPDEMPMAPWRTIGT
ncbi:hypothetical protein ACHAXT_008729 [Thalassiosira profunda]